MDSVQLPSISSSNLPSVSGNNENAENSNENSYEENHEENHSQENNEVLKVSTYSDKSFVVSGDTRTYKEQLKSLGGKFNRNLRGFPNSWIFSNKQMEPVMAFVTSVNTGDFQPESLPTVSNNSRNQEIPSVQPPSNTAERNYQMVKFRIFRPKEGMTVQLKYDRKTVKGTVIKTETNHDVVDAAYVKFDDVTSLAVICRGKWQLWGFNTNHNLFFVE